MSEEPLSPITAAVIGASGFAGGEICRVLLEHPYVETILPVSRGSESFAERHRHLAASGVEFVEAGEAERCDVVFFCTPSGEAARGAQTWLDRGARVVDLSADFRFGDAATYRAAYGNDHPGPDLLAEAVTGIPELYRDTIARARLVANPGCYVTAAVLALLPAVESDVVDLAEVVRIHAINGTSGADATPQRATMHVRVVGSVLPYNLDGHRHAPELEERLTSITRQETRVDLAVAHGDFARGIYLQASVALRAPMTRDQLLQLYLARYGRAGDGEPFVFVDARRRDGGLNEKVYDVYPQMRDVVGSNLCRVGLDVDRRRAVARIVAVIDNLTKGAAGSAVQNMNVMFGFPEMAGLSRCGLG
jgi:N-acetyl-gamma-glutamyl-phosphate reductase common form